MTNELEFDSIEPMEVVQASFDRLIQEKPKGETRKEALRVDYLENSQLWHFE